MDLGRNRVSYCSFVDLFGETFKIKSRTQTVQSGKSIRKQTEAQIIFFQFCTPLAYTDNITIH